MKIDKYDLTKFLSNLLLINNKNFTNELNLK